MMNLIKEIYNDNCINVMDDMIAGGLKVDLTVTSPPYSDLRNYKGTLEWNFDIFKEIAIRLYDVTIDGGVLVWVVADKTKNGSESGASFKQALYFMECGFKLHDTMIYKRWSGPLSHKRYEQEFEYMFVFVKGKIKTFNPMMVKSKWFGKDSDRTGQVYATHDEPNRKLRSGKARGNIKEYRIKGNVWELKNASQCGEQLGHPAPFPQKLAEDHILSWTNERDIVFDPMMGSGTTGKMALLNNRHFYGCEKVHDYFEIARERTEHIEKQIALGI